MMGFYYGTWFYVDALSLVAVGLVAFIGLSVYLFSRTYLKGDDRYYTFLGTLVILVLSVALMAVADNLLLFLVCLLASNLLLVRLMIHKNQWPQAVASGRMARNNFLGGFFFLAIAFVLLYKATGQMSIHEITANHYLVPWIILVLILLTAMMQSAIWPFHRWLGSSLNSPTPASAIMHAGIINGGGIILARFAPLYFHSTYFLDIIFVIGAFTAVISTVWKLIQNDIKRMLAYSTMSQMGYMLVQCGLGLFPLAIAHLCWHAMFKAYLFLGSGGAAQEKRVDTNSSISAVKFLLAIVFGAWGTTLFIFVNSQYFLLWNSTAIITMIVFISASQFCLTLLNYPSKARFILVPIGAVALPIFYGFIIHLTDRVFNFMNIMQPQPLTAIHFIFMIVILFGWLIMLVYKNRQRSAWPSWVLRLYVMMLNMSQPHKKTVTSHRKDYKYV